jgi:hypothetical protein
MFHVNMTWSIMETGGCKEQNEDNNGFMATMETANITNPGSCTWAWMSLMF